MSMLSDYQNCKCYLCGALMSPQAEFLAPDVVMQSIDHVMPKSRGGANRLGNVALAHKGCNNFKADRKPTACEVFFAESMARCFEDSHVAEPYQAFQEGQRIASENRGFLDLRLHVRGKGLMYVRPAEAKPYVISKALHRSLLKRKAKEMMKSA